MKPFDAFPESPHPGQPGGPWRLARREEHREALERLMPLAGRRLELLTPDLEPALFDQAGLQQALRRRIAGHPRLQLRILALDVSHAVEQGNRLRELAREFPSYAAIRRLPQELAEEVDEGFLLVDDRILLRRQPLTEYRGIVSLDAAPEVRRLRARFDTLWPHAETPPDLRRLHL